MGKRSEFDRIERDHYPTPRGPVLVLSPHLDQVQGFAEPCCGNGVLVQNLESLGHHCRFASDIAPGPAMWDACTLPALDLTDEDLTGCSHIITNPPWPLPRQAGKPTLGIIQHFAALRPTWLLLSADFKHNDYAAKVMPICVKIVSVGRVKWIEGSEHEGKDNCAWYLFDAKHPGPTVFIPRAERRARFAGEIEGLL